MADTITRTNPIIERSEQWLDAEELRSCGLYPFFKPIERNVGSKVIIAGRELMMAGSNNYLGLALDERLRQVARDAISDYGTSCSGSRFMNGTLDIHEELEHRLADFIGKPAALCYTTGYQSNVGSVSAIVQPGDHIISDKRNHASIMDGIFMARGMHPGIHLHRYKHNNMDDLERILMKIPRDEAKIIVTDAVFSMEGDIVDLPRMRELADEYGAFIYLDEAHSIGVIGDTGRGATEYFGDPDLADIIMCTFSKSLGSIGGFIAGSERMIDYIKHRSRSLIFSASVPPANAAAVMEALRIIEAEPQRIHRLQEIGETVGREMRRMGFDIGHTQTPIVPINIGDNERTWLMFKAFYDAGVYVNPVITPAVPPGSALLRTSFMATHEDSDIEFFLETAEREGRRIGLI
jgi:8-amino-7-oxononanoate synthase